MLSASTSMPCSSMRRIRSSAMTSDAGASFRPISAIASGTPQCACTSTVFTRRPLTTTSRRRGACARAAGSPSHPMNAMPVSAAALLTNSLRVVIFSSSPAGSLAFPVNDAPVRGRGCIGAAHTRHALPLPARELLRLVVQPLRQPHQLGYALEALFPLIRRQAPHLQPEHDVLRDREVRKERVRLKYHRDAPPGRVERRHIAPFDEDLPFADLLEPGDQPQQRRLPAPRRPEQHHELALLGAKADFIDGLHSAEALRHFIQDDLRHAPLSRWD